MKTLTSFHLFAATFLLSLNVASASFAAATPHCDKNLKGNETPSQNQREQALRVYGQKILGAYQEGDAVLIISHSDHTNSVAVRKDKFKDSTPIEYHAFKYGQIMSREQTKTLRSNKSLQLETAQQLFGQAVQNLILRTIYFSTKSPIYQTTDHQKAYLFNFGNDQSILLLEQIVHDDELPTSAISTIVDRFQNGDLRLIRK